MLGGEFCKNFLKLWNSLFFQIFNMIGTEYQNERSESGINNVCNWD